MARKGLGKGLDSLIPDYYNEDFDSNSTQSLEDLLDNEPSIDDSSLKEETTDNKKNIFEEVEDKNDKKDDQIATSDNEVEEKIEEEVSNQKNSQSDSPSEIDSSDNNNEESLSTSQEEEVIQEHIQEVKDIVDKNPRITLWSSRSSAVFRYLRKTEPEFSISKEASTLIDEAVSKKYPKIWDLFDDY